MPTVVTPKSFFINERRHYSNWRFAFWREFFQNSIDAGAGNIDISLKKDENNNIVVVFSDNGSGMTRDILENVYFRLGETTKTGPDSVGGFGRARILTCFSMHSYEIRTMNLLVKGSGGDYNIEEVDSNLYGTQVKIVIDNESSIDYIENALKEYLALSQMSCSVHINGERWREWSHRRVLCRNLSVNGEEFAAVYVNKSSPFNRIIVRVNGTAMYSRLIRAKAQIIVEIYGDLSRKVLTANRDGMADKYSSALDDFANEIASETLSALKPRFSKKTASFKGGGLLRAQGSKNTTKNTSAPIVISLNKGESPTVTDSNKSLDFHSSSDYIQETKHGFSFAKDLPDIYLEDETENPRIRRVIDSYNPENWSRMVGSNGKEYNKGGTIYKLLMFWKIACEEAARSLMENKTPDSAFDWGVGWIFSDEVEAMHVSRDGGHYFLLNPVNNDGTLKFKLSSKKDRKALMAIAKHEVSHVYCKAHDEFFASYLTDIDRFYDEKATHSKMQEFLQVSNCG